jgi:predicted nuclease of predicted toxin-antitoxin system
MDPNPPTYSSVISFLLDANISPKLGRFLEIRFGLSIVSTEPQQLGLLTDHEIIKIARSTASVIITLDQDFANYFLRTKRPRLGVIYLDLPNELRRTPEIKRLLSTFFSTHAATIDLKRSLVILTESQIHIHRR